MASILIIDDEPAVLGVLRQVLERAGHVVTEAGDGHSALNEYLDQPADLVITDIIMPGMDGIEFLVQVKETFPDARILAMSGGGLLSSERVLKDASFLGADDILHKPFSTAQILSAVERALGTD